ncbi:hypothetical protein BsWGS_11973 [Bradybaena similaris]
MTVVETIGYSRIKTCRNFMYPASISGIILKDAIQDRRAVCSILFPHHCFRVSRHRQDRPPLEASCSNSLKLNNSAHFNYPGFYKRHWSGLISSWKKLSVFPKVYASDTENYNDVSTVPGSSVSDTQTSNNSGGVEGLSQSTLEALARAYIAKETGMDRLRMVFRKDHKGESSPQIMYIKAALVPICAISFFYNYVPAYYFAKSEFIRQHNATAFRTATEAARKMSDYASLQGIIEGGRFSMKVTWFCASFLLISQALATYKNRTSAWDFTIASGITGGFARLMRGPKGFISGSVIGMALGGVYGVVASGLLHLANMTEDVIHLEQVMSRLEVERSIAGDSIFKQRIKELTEQASAMSASW